MPIKPVEVVELADTNEKIIAKNVKMIGKKLYVDELEVPSWGKLGTLEVTAAGSVHHGKSKHEQDVEVRTAIWYSPTKTWNVSLSDTGHWVITEIV
jgi:hypothetical protein